MSIFVAVHDYGTSAEAEMQAEILRAAGIPAVLQGPQAGFYGPGFSGASVQGISLMVPAELANEARFLLRDDGDVAE